MTDPALIIADAVLARVTREYGGPRKVSATVLEFEYTRTSNISLPYARVHVDGDPPGEIRTVPVETPAQLEAGQRVVIAYDLPHGASVTGFAGNDYLRAWHDRPYSTVLVGGYQSYGYGHENAEFQCDGTGDEVTIAQAIQLVVDEGGTGGRVLLLEGEFIIDDELEIPTGVVLAGLGRDVTTITYTGSGRAFDFTGGTLEDVDVYIQNDGVMFDMAGSDSGTIRRVKLLTQGGT